MVRICLGTAVIWILGLGLLHAQPAGSREAAVAAHLDSIRNYPAALTLFFQAMPKGGDLHHHFSGSVYTETYVQRALDLDLYIQPDRLTLRNQPPPNESGWIRLSAWVREVGLYEAERRLLRQWSNLDYEPSQGTAYDDFFDAFPRFGAAYDGPELTRQGLRELKARALTDQVLYLETMLWSAQSGPLPAKLAVSEAQLLEAQGSQDTTALYALLDQLVGQLQPQCRRSADTAVAQIEALHTGLALDQPDFVLRYQLYALRVLPPLTIFADLLTAFQAAETSTLVVGVNLVAPEHHPTALRDYWLHMHYFRYLARRYPQVRYALHAGELTLGLTRPEHLRWHIHAAAHIAGARRIGHGADLAHESNARQLLQQLRERNIAVEINLASNAFILGLGPDHHPLELYRAAGVPLVICTDDEGVLRTNLTEQYVLLAQHYPGFSYSDIKKLVYNSILYSFIEEPQLQNALLRQLAMRFETFERNIWP